MSGGQYGGPYSNRNIQLLLNTPRHLPPRQHPLEDLIHIGFSPGFAQCVFVVKPYVDDDLDGAGSLCFSVQSGDFRQYRFDHFYIYWLREMVIKAGFF